MPLFKRAKTRSEKMKYRIKTQHFTSVIALMIISSVLFCACQALGTESSASGPSTTTTLLMELPDPADWSFEVEGADASTNDSNDDWTNGSDAVNPEETDMPDSSDGTTESTAEPTFIDSEKEVGNGDFVFMRENIKFRSQTDISMLIKPEDGSVYDFGARDIRCTWIDSFYIRSTYGMRAFDASYRFLAYYNNNTSITFKPYREIGTWKTPKGHEFPLYLTEIVIISRNLEIRILPKETNSDDVYTVSINGRGYYASEEQLQMMDYVLSALAKKPYIDPLEGLYTGTDHTYYF